jgi:hypothetical protein
VLLFQTLTAAIPGGDEIAPQRRHRLIWLNPLIRPADYAPLTRGLQAALPFVDDFLPPDADQFATWRPRTRSRDSRSVRFSRTARSPEGETT